MKPTIRLFGLLILPLILVSGFAFADEPAPASTPTSVKSATDKDQTTKTFTGDAQKLRAQMIALFDASANVNDAAKKKQARSLIETSVDWDRIAHDCLGNAQWKKQSAANREQFNKLLRDVIIKTAYSRLGGFWDGTTYRFEKIDVKGKDAVVKSKFMVKDESIVLEYNMTRKGDRWLLTDISYDDIKYSENINEQITTFLKEGKFAGLIDKLKKRLDELEKDSDNGATKAKS